MKKTTRVTIVMSMENKRKLHRLQAKLIQNTNKNISFSGIINQVLEKSLDHISKEIVLQKQV